MINKVNFIISIFVLISFTLASCQKNGESEVNVNINKSVVTLKSLEWIVGTWRQQTSRGTMYESWKIVNDTLWQGKVYRIAESDTMISETLSIEVKDDDIFYVPKVPHNKGAVYFKLIEQSGNNFVFENPEHDFPQRIIYAKMSDDSLHARIEGMNKGVESAVDFYFKRIKK